MYKEDFLQFFENKAFLHSLIKRFQFILQNVIQPRSQATGHGPRTTTQNLVIFFES